MTPVLYEELERKVEASAKHAAVVQAKFETAEARLMRVKKASQLLNAEVMRIGKEVAESEQVFADRFADSLCDGSKKPDAGVLGKLWIEQRIAELALKRYAKEIALAHAKSLFAESEVCAAQAQVQYERSELERARAHAALTTAVADLGDATELEIKNSRYQKTRSVGDGLIAQSRRLRLQAEETLKPYAQRAQGV